MDYIRKLPLLMALSAAIVTGIAGYLSRVPDKENMLKMIIVMIIFGIVGCLIRDTITNIIESNLKKAKEEEEERKRIEEEKRREEKLGSNKKEKGQVLDLTVDDQTGADDDESFDALPVADFIKKELNQ